MGNLECLQNKHSTAQEIKSESFMEDPAVPEHYKHRVDANGFAVKIVLKSLSQCQYKNLVPMNEPC